MTDIVEITVGDYSKLAHFLATFPSETRPPGYWRERFRLWWEANPSFSDDWPRGMGLIDGGDFVGFVGSVPSTLQIGSEIVKAANISTWRVHPEHRPRALNLIREMLRRQEDLIVFATRLGKMSDRLLRRRRTDWGYVPTPTNVRPILAIEEGGIRAAALSDFLSTAGLADSPEATRPRLPAERGNSEQARACRVTKLSAAGAEFDTLWHRTKQQYAATNLRTAEMINWYCFASPLFLKSLWACHLDGKLVGYLISREEQWREMRLCSILDLWFDVQNVWVLDALLGVVVEHASRRKSDLAILPPMPHAVAPVVERHGFRHYVKLYDFNYIHIQGPFADRLTKESCFFTDAQGDNGI
ncbi:MAG: hypothetical protein ABW250_10360 [Pyrinomonadaceae bacterium]